MSRSAGIPFWNQKLEIMKLLLGAFTFVELVQTVYPNPADVMQVDSVLDSLPKWRKHRPRKQKFFDDLASKLGCSPSVTGVMLVDATLEQFIDYLPSDKQSLARRILKQDPKVDLVLISREDRGPGDGQDVATKPQEETNFTQKKVWVSNQRCIESISKGIREGRVNTRHYYLTPDAAESWNRLVNAEAYPTYDQCKAGLRALMECEAWKEAIRAARPTTAVMLGGGGSPTKDLVVLRGLLDHPNAILAPIDYILVDISIYMLLTSMWWLDEHIPAISGHERVNLRLVHGDALNLREWRSMFRQGGKVLFGITGGTIGNFSEDVFFRSLNSVSEEGDLLILSADTIKDGLKHEELEKLLQSKYDHADMHSFIAPVVREVISEFNLQESLSSALERIEVRLRQGKVEFFSDIEDSWSVTLSLSVASRRINLVSSTRYKSDSFITYARGYGWEPVCEVPSPSNAHYVQFLFRRKLPDNSRIVVFAK